MRIEVQLFVLANMQAILSRDLLGISLRLTSLLSKGPFNNYVDKMSVFVHAPGIKTVHAVGGGGST